MMTFTRNFRGAPVLLSSADTEAGLVKQVQAMQPARDEVAGEWWFARLIGQHGGCCGYCGYRDKDMASRASNRGETLGVMI